MVVVNIGDAMTDEEIASELASMSRNALRALVQLFADERDALALNAAGQTQTNNALAMSASIGGYETITRLIHKLNELSKPTD